MGYNYRSTIEKCDDCGKSVMGVFQSQVLCKECKEKRREKQKLQETESER